ncbi:MAG TPA: hypothetical protein VG319_10250 [Polyangia bacterium]|jgi:hypothetical protein|nr:hypothetical protein [Polyangia bacterium]
MTRPVTRSGLVGLVGLLLAWGGCKLSDSILLVEVAGSADLMVSQFSVTVTAGLDARNFRVPPMPTPEPISLPASFTIALDRSHMGPITLSIDALDASGSPIGFGTTMQQHIQIGGQTSISVMLTAELPPDVGDGGADGATDGSSTRDAPDGDGASETDGAAGQDGAARAHGATDDADAMGLDDATD